MTKPAPHRYALVPTEMVRVVDNVRHDVGDLTSLTDSIRHHGIIEPLVGCPTKDGKHVDLIMGQRRYAAAQLAGLKEVPFVLRARPNTRDRLLMQLAENLERTEMSPIEEAQAFRELMGQGLTRSQIAQAIRRSMSWVAGMLKLLDLPECVQRAVNTRAISPSVALEVPMQVVNNSTLASLDDACKRGDGGLRHWIREQAAKHEQRSGTKVKLDGIRVINVSLDMYDLAIRCARRAEMPVGRWVDRAIKAHSK